MQITGAIKLAGFVAFAALYLQVVLRWLRHRIRDEATLVRDLVLLHFVLVCLVASKFYPWYLGMFLPLALLLPTGDWLRRAVLAVACGQLLSLTFINQAHFINVVAMLLLPLAAALGPKGRLRLRSAFRLRLSAHQTTV